MVSCRIINLSTNADDLSSQNVLFCRAGPNGEAAAVCPNVRELTLRATLLSDWREVASLAVQWPAVGGGRRQQVAESGTLRCLSVSAAIRTR